MKLLPMELPSKKNQKTKTSPKIVLLLLVLTIVLLTLISLYSPFPWYTFKTISQLPNSSPPSYDPIKKINNIPKINNTNTDDNNNNDNKECDLFSGQWVPNPEAPYYKNTTCWAIHEHQNCMKHGRPDVDFMKWRWQPFGCDLPIFDPIQFLELMRGKSLALVGDSVARNNLQSLICLLSRVEFPVDASIRPDELFNRWLYKSYNFTLSAFWSTHLVKSVEADPIGPTKDGLFNLYLDEFDEKWTNRVDEFDYLIISSGHWFERPCTYYEKGRLVGCLYCKLENVTELPMHYGYRRAFKTAFKAINSLKNYKGVTFVRTFSPSHFYGGLWNQGGDCARKRPYKRDEVAMDGQNWDLYKAQIEEFRIAEREGKKRGLKFKLFDVTFAMLMRPDGHPGQYWPRGSSVKDCVHWCLPGPIDTWGDFLLELLKRDQKEKTV